MRSLPGLLDVTTDLQLNSPQAYVKIDRDKASALGITATQIDTALYDAYGTRTVSSVLAAADEFSKAPIFIDDSSALSIMQLRAKARRIHARNNLGFIVVDYLQLQLLFQK